MAESESFLNLGDLSGVPEEHTKPEAEYEMRIISLEKREKEKGPFLYVQFELIDDPLAKAVGHVMMIPTNNDDARKKLKRERAIKHFYEAFKIPVSGNVNLQAQIGNTGWALLGEEESDEYGLQNRVKRFK